MAKIRSKTKAITEFGDFQTADSLAIQVTEKLRQIGIQPNAILEPTCGRGAFVWAALKSFPEAKMIVGVEINPVYIEHATTVLQTMEGTGQIHLEHGDFFSFDWRNVLQQNDGVWLILGNPPWVTNSSLGVLESDNLPIKSNVQGRSGIEAVTGKSNFDISEWMLLRYLDWLEGTGTIAVLCKTSVARKILHSVWKKLGVSLSRMYKIDAMAHFGASVDACLFVLQLEPASNCKTCDVYDSLTDALPSSTISYCKGHLVSDISFAKLDALWGPDDHYVWRSGIKHDCARIMELLQEQNGYRNGLGEAVEIEETFLYPMLKGSDIGNGRTLPRAKMLVTQKAVGQQTAGIALVAPDTWRYLDRHRLLLDRRGSVIYRNNPDFSVFGVGPYTFAPWKIAVSSFYKKLLFVAVGPLDNKPMVFDDTVYFISCRSGEEARFLAEILHSELASEFLTSMIHWPDKRPLTIDLLKRLSIEKLASALGRESEYRRFSSSEEVPPQQDTLSFAS